MAGIELPREVVLDELLLRPPTPADVPAIVAAVQDPDIPRFTRVPSPYGDDEGRAFIDFATERWDEGRGASYVIVDRGDGRLLGSVASAICRIPERPARSATGWAADARGRGIATRAVREVSRVALAAGVRRIELKAMVENTGSRVVAERSGYVLEGILRSVMIHGCADDRIDVALYSRLPSDAVSGGV